MFNKILVKHVAQELYKTFTKRAILSILIPQKRKEAERGRTVRMRSYSGLVAVPRPDYTIV